MAENGVWERIAILRAGRTLAAFCREVGLNYQAMKKSLARKTVPDTQSLVKIAEHYRADLKWLISGPRPAGKLNRRIGRNLKQVRKKRGWSSEELAEKLSLTPPALRFYEKGEWLFSPEILAEFAKKLGVPPTVLLQEDVSSPAPTPELKIFQASSARGAPRIAEEDYVSIPLTQSAIAAGQPIIQENNIEDYVLLHIRAAGKRNDLVATRVDGDSMEPMLHSGDIVVIDRQDKKILHNRMYAIFYDDGLTAKYVERQKDLLILRPVNPNAQVQILNLREHPDPVVGRIIGAWKEF